jgi:hypothetical protein
MYLTNRFDSSVMDLARWHCYFCEAKGKPKAYENAKAGWVKVEIHSKDGGFEYMSCPEHVDALRLVVFNFLEDPSVDCYLDVERLGHPIREEFIKKNQPDL